jgi:phage-related minor tail protein
MTEKPMAADATSETAHDLDARQRQLETLDRLAQRFGTSLSRALSGGAADGKRLDTALSSLGRTLTNAATRAAMRPLQATLRKGFESLFKSVFDLGGSGAAAFAKGGVVNGRVTPFASGGVVAAPTYFPLRGGLGLMGDRGAEAVMPLARGPDGRLGVRAGGAARPIAVTVNVTTPDADSFRRSEAQVSAALARAVARGRRGL